MRYRSEIDGLRAIAVLPVVFFHAGFDAFSGGFVGVDVFFVISGYLITTIIINEMSADKFSLINFYERRARRILPALFFVALCCIPAAWFLLLPSDMKSFAQSLIAVATFSSNILFWSESGYFDTAAELKPLLHTWSLAVEEQFYILFPLFLMAAWRFGERAIVWTLIASFIVSLGVAHWGAYNNPSATFFLLPTRAWELLIGSFAAFYLQHNRFSNSQWLNNLLSVVGLGAIVISVFAFDDATPFPSLYALIPTVGTVLIILFAVRGTWTHALLSMKGIVGVGLISYSLYLWHQPVFAFWRHHNVFEPTHTQMLLLSLLCVLLALLTYTFIETPFRSNVGVLNRPKVFGISGAISLLFISCGSFVIFHNGLPQRDGFIIFSDLNYDTDGFDLISCENNTASLNYCFSESPNSNAAIIGDSHGEDKFYGLLGQQDNFTWRMIGNSSCPPIMNSIVVVSDGTDCSDKVPAMFSIVEHSPDIDLVVLSFSHAYPLNELIAATHVALGISPDDTIISREEMPELTEVEAFYLGLQDSIDFLQSKNIQVVILIDIPELVIEPQDCLRMNDGCIFSRESVLLRQIEHRRWLERISSQYDSVHIYDPLEIFCGDFGVCNITESGRVLYRDSHHLSITGSEIYASYFLEWLDKEVVFE